MVTLVGFGVASIFAIPKESSPEVVIPVGIVITALPGASASDVESLVTNKIEQKLDGNLDHLKRLTSTSRTGVSTVVVEFNADAEVDKSIQQLKDEVDKAVPDLPDDAKTPSVSKIDFVDQPILTVAVSGDLTDAEFSVLADQLKTELEKVNNVSSAEVKGARDREVTVIVDQSNLAQYDLSLGQVVSGLQAANTIFPVGAITTDGVKYNIAFEGDIASPDDVQNIPIATKGGHPVYVRDIARIENGYNAPTTITRLSVNSSPSKKAILFDIYKGSGGDITKIASAVNTRLKDLQQPGGLLEGLSVQPVLDSGDQINKDLTRLTRTGISTVILVVSLLILTIGWRESLIAGAAIPLSFTVGFIGLYVSGNTINFVSLFALILAVGILVDSAIVVVEGINRRMKDDVTIDKRKAALATVKEFYAPLMSGTLTTVAMFSGLFLVGGVSGQFISSIPFTVNFILFASILVALGFIPLIASLYLKRRDKTRLEKLQHEYSAKIEMWYRHTLTSFLESRRKKIFFLSAILVAFFIAILLPITGMVKVIFFEQSDIDWIYANIEMPQGTELAVTDFTTRRAEEVLYNDPAIDSFVATVGASSNFAASSGGQNGDKLANFFITLRTNRDVTSTQVVERLQKQFDSFKDAKITVGQPSQGPPTGSPIVVRFLGDNLPDLSAATLRAADYLKTIPGTTNVQTSTNDNSTEFVFALDKSKAAALGLNPLMISQILRTAVNGTQATSITTTQNDIKIVVKLGLNPNYTGAVDTSNTTLNTLENLPITTPSGKTVILSSIINTSLRESSAAINHEDLKRVVTLSADVNSNGNARDINATFLKNVQEKANIPDSVTLSVGGQNEESNQAFQDMFLALAVGIILMLAILVLQFNSYRHTAYILSILPFSLIGIMAGLFLTRLPLSFPSLMGFIALSGIVVNNSILLIDQMNSHRRKEPAKPIKDVVVDAAVTRLRPIILTTLTTVIGIYPLVYASDLWAPLAWAVMFGLSFSVMITLLLVPIIYNRNPGRVD
jgi:HAE1 family hydrophobic/amphiphilic exporter-1